VYKRALIDSIYQLRLFLGVYLTLKPIFLAQSAFLRIFVSRFAGKKGDISAMPIIIDNARGLVTPSIRL
jgi:hypothetical protein